MHFLLTSGTIVPLKGTYRAALAIIGHTCDVCSPSDPLPDVGNYDALLLPGGADIHPKRFGGKLLPNGSETIDQRRDALEFALFDAFQSQQKPISGICRGMQIINVARGGDIWQDLPAQRNLTHTSNTALPMTHSVHWAGGGVSTVNSYHHQAVRALGDGLSVAAAAADGTIEAIVGANMRGVQWHPELLGDGALGWLLGN